jgi:hypothetical protein
MYIGKLPSRRKGTFKKRYLNLHTGGSVYGVKLTGITHNYHIKLNPDRRHELSVRLKRGQEFYE